VGAAALMSSSSQSAELRAESSHMSLSRFVFFPLPRVKIHEIEGGTISKRPIGALRVTRLFSASRAVLLKGQTHYYFSSGKQYGISSTNPAKIYYLCVKL